jgi:hypothetical protein
VLAAQGVLLALVLFVVMRRAARREGDFRAGREFACAAAISAGTVGSEAFLVERAGWLAVIPPLTLALILLARRSWAVLSRAMAVVLLMGASYVGLVSLVERLLRPPEPEAAPEAAEKPLDAISFHQIADHLDFTGPPPEPEPEPPPAAVTRPPPPKPPKPRPNPVDWPAALEQIEVTGTMTLPGGREVAFVDGRMMETGQTVQAAYRDRVYTWRIRDIMNDGVDWEQFEVRRQDSSAGAP